MGVLGIFLIGMMLLCTANGWYPQMISLMQNEKVWQRYQTRQNQVQNQENCPKHCSCSNTGYLVKIKCKISMMPKMSNWTISLKKPSWKPRYIDLSNNSITRIPATYFSKLYKLTMLFLNNNNIRKINVNSFGGQKNLIYLDLSSNYVKDLPPKSFRPLRRLRELFLGNNRIKEIRKQSFYGLAVLRFLMLNNNKIRKLSENSFDGMHYLYKLDLSSNKIRDNLPPTIFHSNSDPYKLKYLTELCLDDNQITFIHNITFQNLSNLKRLSLSNNEISFISHTTLWPLQKLRSLFLANNSLTTLSYRMLIPFSRADDLSSAFEGNPIVCDCKFYFSLVEWYKRRPMFSIKLLEWHGNFPCPELYTLLIGEQQSYTDCKVPPTIEVPLQIENLSHKSYPLIGDWIRFTCEAIGLPTPKVTWNFNGKPLQVNNLVRIPPDDKYDTYDRYRCTNCTIRILGIMEKHAGEYQCIATNSEGSVSSSLVIRDMEKPITLNDLIKNLNDSDM